MNQSLLLIVSSNSRLSTVKVTLNLMIFLFIGMLWSCSSTEYVVESDYSYSGTFNRYKSFNFGTNKSFGGNEEDKTLVEKYIGTTLTAWGYQVEDQKPDIYIFYSLYYDDFKYRGYSQPELEDWVTYNNPSYGKELLETQYGPDSVDIMRRKVSRADVREEYNSVTYDLREGTMLISLVDRRKKKTIWQGYASGILGSDQAKNQRVLRSAIIRILDEFKLLSHNS